MSRIVYDGTPIEFADGDSLAVAAVRLDFARSYAPLVQRVSAILAQPACVESHGLDRGQIAAFQFHAHLNLRPAGRFAACPGLLVDKDAINTLATSVDLNQWTLHSTIGRPSDRDEDVLLYRRATASAP